MKKTALALILILALMFSALTGSQIIHFCSANFFPDPGPDLPRICLRHDGSIEPQTVPIERTGNLYKLTSNIVHYTIEIQRDNIVLDGAGYSILGNASRIKGYDEGNNGVTVNGRNNVNITRVNFEQGDTGIRISGSTNISVLDNTFSNGLLTGIILQDSAQVLIENNEFKDLQTDIEVPSVRLNGSKITFRNNTLAGSAYGLKIYGASNVISDNKIETKSHSIELNAAYSNIMTGNKITGTVLLAGSSNNEIFGNNMTSIRLLIGSNNTLFDNYITSIELSEFAVNNTFYGNTFAAGLEVRFNDAETTSWDNETIGNYWEDYTGTDSNGDGIGDSPYVITGVKWDNDVGGDVSFAADQDNYPLMAPLEIEYDDPGIPQAEPFPTTLLIGSAAVVAVVCLVLLVYLKKRRKLKST